MTLEMGKPLAESKAEIAYAAEFFRWFSEEAVRIEGRFATAPNGQGRAAHHEAAGRPVLRDHAVELPDGDGHAQDRPGGRRRLHDGHQAGAADAAVDARAGADPRGGRAARPACSTSSPRPRRPRSRSRSSPTRGCASSRSPARPRSAASWSSSPPRGCCGSRWSWAATRRSSCSRTPTSTPRSRARVIAKMRNIGEACTAANRFHVAESVADEFAEKLAAQAGRDAGRPRHRGRRQGRPADRRRRSASKVAELVDDAIGKGAEVLVGGRQRDGAGYFYAPTVLGGVPRDAAPAQRGDLRPGRAR